jgi:hypothetical protein
MRIQLQVGGQLVQCSEVIQCKLLLRKKKKIYEDECVKKRDNAEARMCLCSLRLLKQLGLLFLQDVESFPPMNFAWFLDHELVG